MMNDYLYDLNISSSDEFPIAFVNMVIFTPMQ